MSPLILAPCCAAGLVRRDPYTGEERCENCGCPVPLPKLVPGRVVSVEERDGFKVYTFEGPPSGLVYPPGQNVAGAALHGAESPEPVPPILGGQGRDASEVEADAVGTVRLVVLAVLSAAILALGVWAAGGGSR